MSPWPKPIVSSQGGNTMRRQQQRIRHLIDSSGHVAGDGARAKPVRGAVGQHNPSQFQTRELTRPTPESVKTIALVKSRRQQLGSPLGQIREEPAQALGIVPEVVVPLKRQRLGSSVHRSGTALLTGFVVVSSAEESSVEFT